MRSRLPFRLGALALSGALGAITAITLAGGSQTPTSAQAVDLATVAVQHTPQARAVGVLARTAQRTGLSEASELALYRSALLGRQSDAISAQNAAIRETERLRVLELGYDPAVTDPREIARQMMLNRYDWGEDQFQCFDNIIMRESRWILTATNPSSGAYGIPQALPGYKMASAGADWRTNPATQIKWALGYVQDRYGTPCGAWAFKHAHGWY